MYGYYGSGTNSWFLVLMFALAISSYAQIKVSTTFNKYLRVNSKYGYTGYEVAQNLLKRNNIHDVRVEAVAGNLTDHYDPINKVLRLSSNVYSGTSIASISVAAHEVGHAIQHDQGYVPLKIRSIIAPIASIGSRFVWILIFLGMVISPMMIELGISLYLAIVLFQIVTLPVEFNASRRALNQLEDNSYIAYDERPYSRKVLSAAALTYVAATLVAIGELLRLLSITQNRRRD